MRLLVGVAAVFALFEWIATAVGSDRGQAGVLVGAIVIAATVAAERLSFGTAPGVAVRRLGFGVPHRAGMLAAFGVGALLVLVVPAYRALTGTLFEMYPGWARLLPGLFAQAGLAEEVLFRGYLFGHLREGRSFWQAAFVSTGPFVLVHLFMFLTLPWPIAVASVLLAAILSFPLAHLFELGGRTVWAPALIHFVVQGVVKIVVPIEGSPRFPRMWIVASGVLPFAAFLVPRARLETAPRGPV